MKEKVHHFVRPFASMVIVAVALAMVSLVAADFALAAPKEGAPAPAKVRRSPVERTETRIKDLENALKITPAQQESWKALTQVMLDNAKTMETLFKARSEISQNMNAVEDVKSYSQIIEAQADGLKKFIPAFEALYNSMSDEQKKNADVLFKMGRHGKHRRK